ncbi:nucleoside triphosphate pyrophosphohydrolase [Nitrincola sp. MINF-07-Sa-05]|uniref:nucleoside triphosphate pyrophosphohydrolase n=1 Tax=Nitrincola salilacus TaxID=3400273 RepID=UPI003918437A
MSYTLDDLLYLMQRLRDPKDGCPWDLEQTFDTIVPHTLEEVYEVVDTIERRDWTHLQDELGDLLFQVVFYARLAQEEKRFDFAQIIDQLVSKLLRRHPHVFPDGQLHGVRPTEVVDQRQVNQNWESIKQNERQAKSRDRVLDEIPQALPALNRALKLQKRAAQVGFDWDEADKVLDKIEEELAELRQAIREQDHEAVRDEMGDMLFAQVNLCRHLSVEPEQALRGTNAKFERRFRHVEDQVNASGRPWQAFTLDELDQFWNQAKKIGL